MPTDPTYPPRFYVEGSIACLDATLGFLKPLRVDVEAVAILRAHLLVNDPRAYDWRRPSTLVTNRGLVDGLFEYQLRIPSRMVRRGVLSLHVSTPRNERLAL